MQVANLNDSKWDYYSPYDRVSAEFERNTGDGNLRLKVSSQNVLYTNGQWNAVLGGIIAGNVYSFAVRFIKKGVNCTAAALMTWMDDHEIMISRDYAYYRKDGNTNTLGRTVEAPERAVFVRIELIMYCTGEGACEFYNMLFSDEGLYRPRLVKLASTFIDHSGERTFEKNMCAAERAIRLAAKENPDIIVLTECIYDRGVDMPLIQRAVPVPGDVVDRFCELARKYSTYLVICLYEDDNGFIFNTALLLDRNGDIAGKYRKVHLPTSELDEGVVPGDDFPVFDTDFGRVGLLICWDHWFPESARLLALKGAEVICIPTAGFTEYQSRACAAENGVYVVTSCMMGPDKSRIIDRLGEVIAKVERDYAAITVDLNKPSYQYWFSVGPGWGESNGIYQNERRPQAYAGLCDKQ